MSWTIKQTGGGVSARRNLSLEINDQVGIALARVWAAVCWPVDGPGYLLTAGQARDGGHVYLLAEAQELDWQALVRQACQVREALGASLFLHQGGAVGEAFRDRANRLVREERCTKIEPWGEPACLNFDQAPFQDLPHYLAALASCWLKSGRLTILPGLALVIDQLKQAQSIQPREVVQSLPELFALRALLYLLAGFDAWPAPTPGSKAQALELAPADAVAGF